MTKCLVLLLTCVVAICVQQPVLSESGEGQQTIASRVEGWPQFRGPGSAGVVADNPRLPDTWSATQNVTWKTPIPGQGWSSPVAWGERIFVTSVISTGPTETPQRGLYFKGERPAPANEHRYVVYAIDFVSGKIAWEREVHRGVPPSGRHLKNTFASETPATDGSRLYASFGNVGTFAFDFNGKAVWSVPFEARQTRFGWGTASSPVVHEGVIYIVSDNEEASALRALDAATGKQLWRTERPQETNWATPFIWRNERRTEIVVNGTSAIRSYGLDGKPLWTLRPSSTHVIPTPFASGGLLYVSSGYVGDSTRPVYAIKPGGDGDISLKSGETANAFVAWALPQGGTYNTSAIVYGGRYYTLFDRGFFTCHDAATGGEIYTKVRLDPTASGFTASPWAYNGKIFAMSEDGTTYVIEAGTEFKVVGQNRLDEFTMATPAIHRDSLIIRTATSLYRISR
ncbi:MAG TPA: PQQ-binding-like beta-propeller repeat protein [Vicinamibacterales bacterium]|nr:PQQ-binding-like beta-propeller repeat protein [Vicinamibacterales bacterium]